MKKLLSTLAMVLLAFLVSVIFVKRADLLAYWLPVGIFPPIAGGVVGINHTADFASLQGAKRRGNPFSCRPMGSVRRKGLGAFLPRWGRNKGSHQCLHWWQELSTGQFPCGDIFTGDCKALRQV